MIQITKWIALYDSGLQLHLLTQKTITDSSAYVKDWWLIIYCAEFKVFWARSDVVLANVLSCYSVFRACSVPSVGKRPQNWF
jgi:hypothetical protein